MTVKLLTEQHLEFLSLKGGCTGLSESTLVKIPHCWKSHVAAHIFKTSMGLFFLLQLFFVVAYWTFNPAFECITQCKLLQYVDVQKFVF